MSSDKINLPTDDLNDAQIKKILLEEHYINEDEGSKAETQARLHRVTLVDYLISEGIITKNILGQAIAEFYKVSYADLDKIKTFSTEEEALAWLQKN